MSTTNTLAPAETDPAPPRSLRQLWRNLQWPLSLVILLALWEGSVRYFQIQIYILPPPSAVAIGLVDLFGDKLLYTNAAVTFGEAAAGFLIGGSIAFLFAILISETQFGERIVYPYFSALQSMPKVALAPIIVIWCGYGYASKIALSALLALFPMLVNFVQGLKSADAGRLRMLRSFNATPWQTLQHVRLPYASPFFLAGVQLGLIYAMLGALVGEFVGSRAGLGSWLMAMNMNLDTTASFGLLVIFAAYGICVQKGIGAIRRRLLFWNELPRPDRSEEK